MFRKSIAILVLISMIVHCAGRLGILDHLYKNRNEIAETLGFIKEAPIAMCSSDYDFDHGLKIETDDSTHSFPPSSLHAREINLFFVTEICSPQVQSSILQTGLFKNPHDLYSLALVTSIFHPPSA